MKAMGHTNGGGSAAWITVTTQQQQVPYTQSAAAVAKATAERIEADMW